MTSEGRCLSSQPRQTGSLCKADRYGPVKSRREHCLKRIARNTKRAQLVLEEILDVARSEEHFSGGAILFETVIKESVANALEVTDTRTAERLQSSDDRETPANP